MPGVDSTLRILKSYDAQGQPPDNFISDLICLLFCIILRELSRNFSSNILNTAYCTKMGVLYITYGGHQYSLQLLLETQFDINEMKRRGVPFVNCKTVGADYPRCGLFGASV
jgi:hypothetical protein